MYKAYLIDLDGTAYHGTKVVKETLEFVGKLHQNNIPYLFLTNNSTKTPEMVAHHLEGFGYPVKPEQVYTSAMATAEYIHDEAPTAAVYAIGETGLLEALKAKGLTLLEKGAGADYVAIGLDREITYDKLGEACFGVRKGAKLIVTNGDKALPTENGLMPGNGSLAAVVSVSTGVEPVIIGKPHAPIMEKALELLGFPASEVAVIGDNYHTDILGGLNQGVPSIFIEGGVSTREEVEFQFHPPTHILKDLSEWDI
ncbi:MAG: TIGR01457 family HAD-type hydrolase [Turicibacter sp.]|nr:TIGR01457 family HAD-type hydrolase [Turicibacter sp.]